jgi:hypothetical protein
LTPGRAKELLEAQGGVCAICKTLPEGKGRFGTWNVDHDHETGEIRGLLCGYCNSMLGYAKDDPETLRAGMDYLMGQVWTKQLGEKL